jgi:hypothetical protein
MRSANLIMIALAVALGAADAAAQSGSATSPTSRSAPDGAYAPAPTDAPSLPGDHKSPANVDDPAAMGGNSGTTAPSSSRPVNEDQSGADLRSSPPDAGAGGPAPERKK